MLVVEQPADRLLVDAVRLVLETVDLDRVAEDAFVLLEGIEREPDLMGRRRDDLGQFARAEPDRVEPVEPDQCGRGVDRVHHVVERPGERVDVLAVERGDEGPVQTLNDPVRQEVALVLDLLDLVSLVPERMRRLEHLLEQPGANFQLVGQRLEVGEELLFARNQSEGQSGSSLQPFLRTAEVAVCSRTARPEP